MLIVHPPSGQYLITRSMDVMGLILRMKMKFLKWHQNCGERPLQYRVKMHKSTRVDKGTERLTHFATAMQGLYRSGKGEVSLLCYLLGSELRLGGRKKHWEHPTNGMVTEKLKRKGA